MNENLHNIDDLFKKTIEEFEEEPSSNVWEAIDKDLDKKKVVSISKKYDKLKLAASFLLIFSLGMAMYILQLNKKNKIQLNKSYDLITLKNKKEELKNETEKESNISNNNSSIQKEISSVKAAPLSDISGQNRNSQGLKNENAIKQLSGTNSKKDASKEIALPASKLNSANINSEEKNSNTVGNLINNNPEDENFNKSDINKSNKIISKINAQKSNVNNGSKSTRLLSAYVLAVPFSKPEIMMSKNISLTSLNIANSSSQKYTGTKNSILKRSGKSPFYATVFFSPDIVSYNIKSDQPQYAEDSKSEIKKNEKPQYANSFGVLVGYKINKNWIIQSGMMISNRVTSINSKTIYALPDRNGNINYRLSCFTGPTYIPLKSGAHPAVGDSTTLSAKNSLQYISIPIVFQYRIIKGRLSISPGAGIGTNILLLNKIQSIIYTASGYQNSKINTSGLRSVYFNSFINLNADYKISNRIAFSFTPVARFGLSAITKNVPVKTMLNSFGFGAGLIIEL